MRPPRGWISSPRVGAFVLACAIASLTVASARAEPGADVPPAYRDVYRGIEASLDRALAATSGRPVTGRPVFAASNIAVNANRGGALLAPATAEFAELMMARFAEMGLSGVTFDVNFPILDPQYHAFIGEPAEAADRLAELYRRLADSARRKGLKVIVESSQVFTNPAYSTMPVRDYYRSLDLVAFEARRLAMFKRIAEAMRPDWFTVAEESDTMQKVTGMPVDDPAVLVPMVGRFAKALKAQGIPGMRIGAGFGTWHPRWRELAEGYIGAGVDFLNLHIYGINDHLMQRAIDAARLARASGKGVVVGEAWVYKTQGREGIDGADDPTVFARDPYAFWAPLDAKFLKTLTRLARTEGFEYVSPFWSTYLFGYADGVPDEGRGAVRQGMKAANRVAAENIRAGRLSFTGGVYSALARGGNDR